MKIQIRQVGLGITTTSPDFEVSEEQLEHFFDEYVGSEDQSPILFWRTEISQNEDTIVIEWLSPVGPSNWCMLVDVLSKELGAPIEPYSNWKVSYDG